MTAKTDQLTTCLWFDREAEQAAEFYTGLFGGEITEVSRYPDNAPDGRAGEAMLVTWTMRGQQFSGLNGGPGRPFTEAISLQIPCVDQADVDRYWDALTADGGEESMCGWLTDKFGLSWQVVPTAIQELFGGSPEQSNRVNTALRQMKKIDIPALQAAYDGG